ncbi:hypothetical protein [Helicobacter sp.]|uniref:hypothetical protein n=1 Tax=Helicobacter sp. TaxID=218 RepID=UPI0025904672|nr:hypothetical protein [Helicobacter sp.]MCI7046504.1 hypothetical protein [Helicobacter sp.]
MVQNKFIMPIKWGITKALKEAADKNNGVVSAEDATRILSEVDYYRADLEPYALAQLTDINEGGHWDLFGDKESGDYVEISIEGEFQARNPKDDIRDEAVAIDFGTKATTAALSDSRGRKKLIRIGSDILTSLEFDANQYENPTIIEFINKGAFSIAYGEKEGRPDTKWVDLPISHTAFNNMHSDSIRGSDFYRFFADLKQWAGDKNRKVFIKDNSDTITALKPFIELEEKNFNPIEVYAYYIGSYINNMRNGIYLHYLLSYPVKYEKEVKDKLKAAFERGIKKSLPPQILNDKEIMQDFRVELVATEPAAYAITALQEYEFKPKGNENIFYGVFDFGGGTTDFDFGVWREGPDDYPYEIEHFSGGGDVYLGGENLLELLAYKVFESNKKLMLDNKLQFTKPTKESGFHGSEHLVATTQEARVNTEIVANKLRPIWEQIALFNPMLDDKILPLVMRKSEILDKATKEKNPKNLEKEIQQLEGNIQRLININKGKTEETLDDFTYNLINGLLRVDLLNANGENVPVDLVFKPNDLINVLRKQIDGGVDNFFAAWIEAFGKDKFSARFDDKDKFYIFLAGNSCKSPLVTLAFKRAIREVLDKSKIKNDIVVLPPLASKAAKEVMKQRGCKLKERDPSQEPSGKTGVAFGLISGSDGTVFIKSEVKSDKQAKFKYFVGSKGKNGGFKELLDQDSFNKVVVFSENLSRDRFKLYYTQSAKAARGECDLDSGEFAVETLKLGKTYTNCALKLRVISPDTIEYFVENSNGKVLESKTLQLKD